MCTGHSRNSPPAITERRKVAVKCSYNAEFEVLRMVKGTVFWVVVFQKDQHLGRISSGSKGRQKKGREGGEKLSLFILNLVCWLPL
jgi:hypothetical protein